MAADDFRENPPPEVRALPAPWRNAAMEIARRGPRHARVFARMLEEMFDDPFDGELRSEAARIAAWLRTTARD